MSRFFQNLNFRTFREFFWGTFFLVSALLLALLSSMAQGNGNHRAATLLAFLSLILAVAVCFTLVPRLLQRVRIDLFQRFHSFQVTRRGVFFLLIVLIVGFATLNSGNNLLVLVLSVLIASLLASIMVSNLILQELKITLNLPDSIHAGNRAVLFVTLENLKRYLPSFALKLKGCREAGTRDGAPEFFLRETEFPYVRPGRKQMLKLHCDFRHRGIYPVSGFEVRTSFPFGFFARRRRLEARGNIRVFPALLDLRRLFASHPYLQGPEEQNRKGIGTGLYNIRTYQRGDDGRHVHWKSTAKLSRLMVKDFAREEETPLRVIFSTHLPDFSPTALQQFEKAVSCLASLAHHFFCRGQRFSLESGEFEITTNGRRENYETLMEYLASVQPSRIRLVRRVTPEKDTVLFTAGDSMKVEGIPRVDYLKL